MPIRLMVITLLTLAGIGAGAQPSSRYAPPRTEHGQPDIQGVWATEFLTLLERPPGVDYLVASPEQARALVATARAQQPPVNDPDVAQTDKLALVKGEYRTSVIVDPRDGKMPLSQAGLDLLARISRSRQVFDGPEQRPLSERCLENLTYAPIRTVPVLLPRQIVQTRDYLVIAAEDAPGPRIIHLNNATRPEPLRTVEGYSLGHWEGDTLVVQTTHFRTQDPSRFVIGRPLLLSGRSSITERFTRVSPSELFYRFTVNDSELYTQPWSGEFSMMLYDGPIYEYACHEGNYSLPNILRGGQAEAAARAKATADPK
jgi:hypothetical protein